MFYVSVKACDVRKQNKSKSDRQETRVMMGWTVYVTLSDREKVTVADEQ